MHNSNDIQEF